MRSRILFLSGRHEDARDLTRMLLDVPVILDYAQSLQQARTQLQQDAYEVILTEAVLPDGAWLDALQLALESSSRPEVIVTDPLADERLWAEAINLGAYDLVVQPFDGAEVRRILGNACERMAARAARLAAA